jgi:hypothetical protein
VDQRSFVLQAHSLERMTDRRAGIVLLIAAAILVLLGFGLAFTIFGEIALLLAVVALAAGTVITVRSNRR